MTRIHLGVAHDHILAQTKFRKPIIAIEELIWNGLDADATRIDVNLHFNKMEGLDRIVVTDNGHGIPHDLCQQAFGNIGGSPKLKMRETPQGRRPHGKSGRGRLKAFGLGRLVKWRSRYLQNGHAVEYSIKGHKATIDSFDVGDLIPLKEPSHGVEVEISELDSNFPSLLGHNDDAASELSHRLALYLNKYPGIQIRYDGHMIDPTTAQTHIDSYPVTITVAPGESYPSEVTVIEWKHSADRALYLCDRDGFARDERAPGIQAKGWQFTAYLKSELIERLDDENAFGLDDLHPALKIAVDSAKDVLKTHFRKREKERAADLVKQWQDEKIYPYESLTNDPLTVAEREVFDVCAMNVHEYLPDFEGLDRKNKLLTFKLIKQGLETNSSSLQTILREVLALPPEKQNDLAQLLERTQLGAIINAAKVVLDRLDFLACLDELVYGAHEKTLNEPQQLHPIMSEEMWIFGEQYLMGVDEESLKSLLRKHIAILGRADLIGHGDEVKDLDGRDRFVDLMLYRQYPQGSPNQFEHLVIELKRPSVRIGQAEIGQIEKYAFTVAKDRRFNKRNTRWTFLLIGNELDDFAKQKCDTSDRKFGHIYTGPVNIWVQEWSTIIAEAKWRYEFFRKKLECQISSDDAQRYLKEKHAQYFAEPFGRDAAAPAEPEKASVPPRPSKKTGRKAR